MLRPFECSYLRWWMEIDVRAALIGAGCTQACSGRLSLVSGGIRRNPFPLFLDDWLAYAARRERALLGLGVIGDRDGSARRMVSGEGGWLWNSPGRVAQFSDLP